jgi:hypothetical protein
VLCGLVLAGSGLGGGWAGAIVGVRVAASRDDDQPPYTVTEALHLKCSALRGGWRRGISPHILSLPPLPPRHLLPLGLGHG